MVKDDFFSRCNNSNQRFEDWKNQNPGATYKDFYASVAKRHLDAGKPHPSLGGRLKKGTFETSGEPIFRRLRRVGLRRSDTVVDYGCGTLRLGLHAIRYLDRGAYWGLDVAEFLLSEGRSLIGEDLWQAKRPNLRVISKDSITEAAAARPHFVFSIAVLIHVHPDELDECIDNLATLIGTSGRGFIAMRCSSGTETIQHAARGWTHPYSRVVDAFATRGASIEILKESEIALQNSDISARALQLLVTGNRY